jgi:hypothetical protein
MKINRPIISAVAAAAFACSPALSAEQASSQTQIGILNCTIEGGTGFIIGSTKKLTCVFDRGEGKPGENYSGEIKKFGIDIGETKVSKLSWAVFAPSQVGDKTDLLAGKYGGVSAEATVGVGLGTNVLVGGSEKSIALQPFSVQTQEGLNFAAAISSLELSAK